MGKSAIESDFKMVASVGRCDEYILLVNGSVACYFNVIHAKTRIGKTDHPEPGSWSMMPKRGSKQEHAWEATRDCVVGVVNLSQTYARPLNHANHPMLEKQGHPRLRKQELLLNFPVTSAATGNP